MASRIVPAIAIPPIHPRRNAGPFERARGVTSIITTATIGIGLMATPTANGSSCPIASPMAQLIARPHAHDVSGRRSTHRDRRSQGFAGGAVTRTG
jgi:hypothetical protein